MSIIDNFEFSQTKNFFSDKSTWALGHLKIKKKRLKKNSKRLKNIIKIERKYKMT